MAWPWEVVICTSHGCDFAASFWGISKEMCGHTFGNLRRADKSQGFRGPVPFAGLAFVVVGNVGVDLITVGRRQEEIN